MTATTDERREVAALGGIAGASDYLRAKGALLGLAIARKDGGAAAEVLHSIGEEGYPTIMRTMIDGLVRIGFERATPEQQAELFAIWTGGAR